MTTLIWTKTLNDQIWNICVRFVKCLNFLIWKILVTLGGRMMHPGKLIMKINVV